MDWVGRLYIYLERRQTEKHYASLSEIDDFVGKMREKEPAQKGKKKILYYLFI